MQPSMMFSRAVIAAACIASATAVAAPARSHRFVTRAGDWRLTVSRNTFTNDIACSLRARNGTASFRNGAVGIALGRKRDVSAAVYRIDGGRPRSIRDDRPELLQAGVPVEAGGILNPTGGVVWIPYGSLADANSVSIQPRPGDKVKTIHFRGLRGLYQVARERGCAPDSRFVR